MKEIEVKILEIDISETQKRIELLGGEKLGEWLLVDRSFDTPTRTLKESKTLFRLRTNGTQSFLTLKKNAVVHDGIREQDEYETQVQNLEVLLKILSGLGYEQIRYREKKRISYMLEAVRIEIDEYPTIPPYIELEGSEEAIRETVSKLGYTMEQTVPWTVTELLEHYRQDTEYQAFIK